MTSLSTIDALAAEPFVSLTTFRRNGTPVATPVWIARDGGTLVVYTLEDSGKVKRLRRDPRVELRPCNRRGVVSPGTAPVPGVAEVVTRSAQHVDALRRKYGLQHRIAMVFERLTPWRGERVILQITLSDRPS